VRGSAVVALRIIRGIFLTYPIAAAVPSPPSFTPRMPAIRALACAAVLALLAACASTPRPLGPGEYRVRSGDTLHSIARAHGETVAALMRANKLSNANRIDVGQVLRITSEYAPARAAARTHGGPARRGARAAPVERDEAPVGNIALAWPAAGTLVHKFGAGGAKGLEIAAAAGTSIVAAAPGSVAYVGNALRGYGNLVILRHTGNFMTVYAHNRKLLVKEGQNVRQGQTIAEMGTLDGGKPALYFEVRAGGKSVDPMRFLPAR
jgi:lipoprotein YgeR